jgi:hypothetical protein
MADRPVASTFRCFAEADWTRYGRRRPVARDRPKATQNCVRYICRQPTRPGATRWNQTTTTIAKVHQRRIYSLGMNHPACHRRLLLAEDCGAPLRLGLDHIPWWGWLCWFVVVFGLISRPATCYWIIVRNIIVSSPYHSETRIQFLFCTKRHDGTNCDFPSRSSPSVPLSALLLYRRLFYP